MKIGSLFELAEKRLIQEMNNKTIPCYTELDILEYAIKIRKWLDQQSPAKIKKILKITPAEKKKLNKEARHRYYLKMGK